MEPFSESPYDWSRSVPISLKPVEDYEDLLGGYNYRTREIRINPSKGTKISLPDTTAHEISHWKLDHKGLDDAKVDLKDFLEESGMGVERVDNLDSKGFIGFIQNLVHEFEVRLYQESKGLYRYEDAFFDYIISELKEVDTVNLKRSIIWAGYQSIKNMLRRKILSRSNAIKYRQILSRVGKKYGVNYL